MVDSVYALSMTMALFIGFSHSLSAQGNNGFQIVREALGYDQDPSNFDNLEADGLRNSLKNVLISYQSVEDYGGGGAQYTEHIVFCADGTFTYKSTSAAHIAAPGSGMDIGNMNFSGYWETFTQNGMMFIALFTDDPQVTSTINSKGFIPYLVKSYDTQAIRIAGDGKDMLYRKSQYPCTRIE